MVMMSLNNAIMIGVALTFDQFDKLKELIPEIDEALND